MAILEREQEVLERQRVQATQSYIQQQILQATL